jgi:tetratricopeptide (TPR) repeat protein
MHSSLRAAVSLFSVLAVATTLGASQGDRTQSLNRRFQSAVSHYNSGQYPQAAQELEALVREVPRSFEVHELLGLVYSAQSDYAKANPHLEQAVSLNPHASALRTNLAVNLVHLGKLDLAEREFKKAIAIEPGNYDANHDLGEFYIRAEKVAEAVPYLEQAQKIEPSSYDNGYDLSLAYTLTGHLASARRQIHELLKTKDTAELHNLLGEVEEKDGKFIAAANEYQLAAQMEPSESNLFDWGCELLLHRTLGPAIEVFQHAVARYPDSPRLAIGLGIALYSRGAYDEAVKALLRAADLSPSDPRAYLFLSKAYDSSPKQADEVIQHFRRFSKLEPHNALALYYYAMSLWKGKRAEDPDFNPQKIESLLERAIELDPKLAEARFQLGNLYSDQKDYAHAVPLYERALELDASLEDAHYRLGQAYVHVGKRDQAQEQFKIYQRMRAQHLAELDKQRSEIRQFVFSTKTSPSAKP